MIVDLEKKMRHVSAPGPSRGRMSVETAIEESGNNTGVQFDGNAVEYFMHSFTGAGEMNGF